MSGSLLAALLFACAGACGMWKAIGGIRRTRCPHCAKPSLVIQPVARPDQETRLRCSTCSAELYRVDGELIDRGAFEAGRRELLPRARVIEERS